MKLECEMPAFSLTLNINLYVKKIPKDTKIHRKITGDRIFKRKL